MLVKWAVDELQNDQVHAAGTFDVDSTTAVAVRSRATPCSSVFSCAVSITRIHPIGMSYGNHAS